MRFSLFLTKTKKSTRERRENSTRKDLRLTPNMRFLYGPKMRLKFEANRSLHAKKEEGSDEIGGDTGGSSKVQPVVGPSTMASKKGSFGWC